MTGTCSIDGCEKPAKARGWCAMHYWRWSHNGDPLIRSQRVRPSVADRFWSRVDKTDDCWLWTGCITGVGYGALYVHPKMVGAHRVSYELHIGPVPDGLDLDHLCRVRHCVNPEHLEPVTRSENLRRGAAVQKWGSQLTGRPTR